MRGWTVTALAIALAGCAEQPHGRGGPHGFGPGGAHHRHGPGGPGGPGGPSAGGRLFISPMGEPFRPADGDARAAWFDGADADHDGRLTLAEFQADARRFFATLDVDHDGEIGPEEIDRYETRIAPEIRTGGAMGFARAGGGGSGRGGGGRHGGGMGGGGGHRGGGGMGGGGGGEGSSADGGSPRGPTEPVMQGAARFGLLDLPEPVTAADANLNRGVSAQEFEQAAAKRFAALDVDHQGVLVRADILKMARGGVR